MNYAFGVTARGFAPVSNVEDVDIAAEHDAAKGEPAMRLRMPPGTWHAAKFVCGETPWSGPVVLRTARAGIGRAFSGGLPQHHARPDAGGKLDVARLPEASVIVLGDAAALPLPAPLAMPLHTVALLGRIAADEARDALTFDLARLQPLALQVLGAAGAPAEGANVAFLLKEGDAYTGALNGLATDRSGRIAVLAPTDLPLVAVAWTDDGCVVARIEPGARGDKPCVLQLAPVAAVAGVVTGKDGKPVAFARVAAWVSGGSGGDASALGCALQRVAATTARDGSFRLPLYPGLHYMMRGVVTADAEHYLQQQWTVGKDEPTELPIDLAKPR